MRSFESLIQDCCSTGLEVGVTNEGSSPLNGSQFFLIMPSLSLAHDACIFKIMQKCTWSVNGLGP